MRVIHLCFQLHESYVWREPKNVDSKNAGLEGAGSKKELGHADSENAELESEQSSESLAGRAYFDSAADFAKKNETIYQPFFALLERNTQRYSELHFSIQVSGLWLELAERYDAELVARLKKLVKMGRVELILEPYYHSLAFFYDKDEFSEQIELEQRRVKQIFGKDGRFLAMPYLLYNDKIANWAEKNGFVGMLTAGSNALLGNLSANHVYEAAECKYLRVLVGNSVLVRKVTEPDKELLVERKNAEEERSEWVLSAVDFVKMAELASLRGEILNLYFDVEIFARLKKYNIAKFFDDLLAFWLMDTNNCFLNAAEAVVAERPAGELKVEDVVGVIEAQMDQKGQAAQLFEKEYKKMCRKFGLDEKQDDGLSEKSDVTSFLPVLAETTGVKLPGWLRNPYQVEAAKAIYGMRREVLASEEQELIETFRKLTAADYLWNLDEAGLKRLQKVLKDLRRRVQNVKKAQAVEISRNYTKRHERTIVVPKEENVLRNGELQGKKSALRAEQPEDTEVIVRRVGAKEVKDENDEVVVQRARTDEQNKMPETQEEVQAEPEKKPERKVIRKLIRRLVIE